MKRASCKLTKPELADALAKALNLLNHVRSKTEEGCFPNREEDDFNALAHVLRNEDVRADFWNNGTLDARDLI